MSPRVIVEVGAERGLNTANLLRFSSDRDCTVHVVDVAQQFDPAEFVKRSGGTLEFHLGQSLDLLPQLLSGADAVLLDGDHNWYTAHGELVAIDARAGPDAFPLVLLHDVGWPYGRRDGYHHDESVPAEHRQACARRNIAPGHAGTLDSGGMLGHNLHALTEGGPRNGVCCAVEDLLATTSRRLAYAEIPGFHGLGVLAEADVMDRDLAWVRDLSKNAGIAGYLEALERSRLEALQMGVDQEQRAERAEAALALAPEHEAARAEGSRQVKAALAAIGPAGSVAGPRPIFDDGGRSALFAALASRDLTIKQLRSVAFERDAELFVMRAGNSWRLTSPLRRLASLRRPSLIRRRRVTVSPPRVSVPLASLQWHSAQTPDPVRRPLRWADRMSICGQERETLDQHPPSRIAYRVRLPGGCLFSTYVAVRPDAWAAGLGGVRCSVTLLDGSGRSMARAAVDLDPHGVPGHRRWVHLTLDLPAYATDGELLLETRPATSSGSDAVVCWGDPALLVPAGGSGELGTPQPTVGPGPVPAPSADPLISVLVPVHDPPPELLRQAIESLLAQSYLNWQLCVADDASENADVVEMLDEYTRADQRIDRVRLPRSGGISAATNAALRLATGEFVALLDHDDLLAEDALEAVTDHLRRNPDTDVVYTDEDRVLEDGTHFGAMLKPDWSPELLRGGMYVNHLSVFRRRLLEEIGGLRGEFDGSQDFDLMLRASEETQRVGHVPRVLYHWRAHSGSVALNPESKPHAFVAAQRALAGHLDRCGIEARAERSRYWGLYRNVHAPRSDELLSVVVPYENGSGRPGALEDLSNCVRAIADREGHRGWELICATSDENVARCRDAVDRNGHARVTGAGPAPSRASLLRAGVRAARGRHLVLLTDLCVPTADGWLSELLGYCRRDEIGVAGAKVLSACGTVVHGGVVIGQGLPLAAHRGAPADYMGYMGRLAVASNYTAVDGVVMTSRDVYDRLGGLGEGDASLAIIDLCLRAREQGLRNVLAPAAELTLMGTQPDEAAVPVAELARFKRRWSGRVGGDPYYHPAFSQVRGSLPAPSVQPH